jgi:membrane fusion protein (multidrug efflux system)
MKTILKHKLRIFGAIGCLMLAALFIAIDRPKGKVAAPPASPPEVEVVQVEQKDVPIYTEWIGTLDGTVNADIKAQVTGYLLTKNYAEGSFVKKGQLLFEIDPRPFQAALDQASGELAKAQGQLAQADAQLQQAQAQVAQAQADQGKTQLYADRYTQLIKTGVVSQQDYDNTIQANLAATAAVKAAEAGVNTAQAGIDSARSQIKASEAAVKTSELNLGFTRITAPIDGIAGVATVEVGNLVNPQNPTSPPLTTVSTVDPIKVNFSLTEQDYLTYSRLSSIQSKWGADGSKLDLELELVLADGTTHPQKGRFSMADRQVDQKTGSIRLAGLFPNPGNRLRPGQYARVRAVTGTKKGALLVPQRAVTELQGSYGVAVVGADNKVSIRPVKVGDRIGPLWVIEEGLQPGERVVAEGTQKVRPDAVVNPKPLAAPLASAHQTGRVEL